MSLTNVEVGSFDKDNHEALEKQIWCLVEAALLVMISL